MAQQKDKGTGAIVGGGGLAAYGAANAPVLRGGSKDKTRMVNASPKKQGTRYQAELHRAMKAGKVKTDSPVNVFQISSGRYVNAGGTHRQIAREAMGKPSQYEVKRLSHEIHVSPVQAVQGRMKVAGLKRGSKRAEAGKKVRSVSDGARGKNFALARAADTADDAIWRNPGALKAPLKIARAAGLVGAGAMAATGAGIAGVGLHDRKKWKESQVHKGRIMSDAEIRRRKKVQGHISQTTGALGLAGVGVGTAAALASKKPGALKAIHKVPGLKKTTSEGLKDAGLYTSLASGGIGGAGSFNFASYTGAESRKRKQAVPVTKSMDMGWYGEEGAPVVLEEIVVPIEKSWSPVARNFDSEANRHRRNQITEVGAAGAAGGLGGAALNRTHHGLVTRAQALEREAKGKSGLKARKLSNVRFKQAGKLGAGAAVAGAAAVGIHQARKSKSWESYGKRDTTSAFGIDHTEWTAP